MGNLPGIGRSGSCCCCVEQLASRFDDAQSIVAPAPPVLIVGPSGGSDMTLRSMAPGDPANPVACGASYPQLPTPNRYYAGPNGSK